MSGDVDGFDPRDGSVALPGRDEQGSRSHQAPERRWDQARRSDDPLLSVRDRHAGFDTDDGTVRAGDGVSFESQGGDRASAVDTLDEPFSTVCEEHRPAVPSVKPTRTVERHLYDDGTPGEPGPERQRPDL